MSIYQHTATHTPDGATLMSSWEVVDVELNDLEVEGHDASETITVTFAPGRVTELLGLQARGMLPAQASELALALLDASREWQEGGALYDLNTANL